LTQSATTRTPFRLDVQGLRAIAVALVVLYHAGVPGLSGGYVGVDVFFVISGFLITGQILDQIDRGRFSFGSFYAKRARRILPASFVVVILTVIAALIWISPLQRTDVLHGAISTALYVPNMLFAFQGTDYLASDTPSLFQHYWSLGVEEQFYLLWPAILVALFLAAKAARLSRRVVFWALVALVILSFGAGVLLTFRSQPWAFFSLPTRAWELGVGAIVLFMLRAGVRLPARVAVVGGWVGIVGLVMVGVLYTSATPFPGFAAAGPVLATALVILSGTGYPRGGPTRLLSTRPFQFIGLISYSLYLVHWPIIMLPQQAMGEAHAFPTWATLLLGLSCLPIAWLLYRFVETPARHLPALEKARPRVSLLWAGGASVATVAASLVVLSVLAMNPLSGNRAVAAIVISNKPIGTAFVPSNLTPSLVGATNDIPSIYGDGCHEDAVKTSIGDCLRGDVTGAGTIALFGDSHAAQWFPALDEIARSKNEKLQVYTKSGCPSVSIASQLNGVAYAACDAWRENVIAHLRANPVDTIVISNLGLGTLVADDAAALSEWRAGLTRTLKQLTDVSDVILIGDTPNFVEEPAACLAQHLDDAAVCGRERAEAVDSKTHAAEQEIAQAAGVEYIDMTDYLCTRTFCPVILGDKLVYRDQHHLTASFVRGLTPLLEKTFARARLGK